MRAVAENSEFAFHVFPLEMVCARTADDEREPKRVASLVHTRLFLMTNGATTVAVAAPGIATPVCGSQPRGQREARAGDERARQHRMQRRLRVNR